MAATKKITLLTIARISGVLRSPAEGEITAPTGEANRLIDDKKAVSASAPKAKAGPKKAARAKKTASPRARARRSAPPPAGESPAISAAAEKGGGSPD
jgi:hypothetical protein